MFPNPNSLTPDAVKLVMRRDFSTITFTLPVIQADTNLRKLFL